MQLKGTVTLAVGAGDSHDHVNKFYEELLKGDLRLPDFTVVTRDPLTGSCLPAARSGPICHRRLAFRLAYLSY